MNEMLMHIIIDQILFLELSDDSIVEPDATVAQLGQIAYGLQKLDQKEREIFTAYIDQILQLKMQLTRNG